MNNHGMTEDDLRHRQHESRIHRRKFRQRTASGGTGNGNQPLIKSDCCSTISPTPAVAILLSSGTDPSPPLHHLGLQTTTIDGGKYSAL